MKTIFITGIAGMIGFHSARKFKENGWNVTGIDNFNDYYDPKLKLMILFDIQFCWCKIDMREFPVVVDFDVGLPSPNMPSKSLMKPYYVYTAKNLNEFKLVAPKIILSLE